LIRKLYTDAESVTKKWCEQYYLQQKYKKRFNVFYTKKLINNRLGITIKHKKGNVLVESKKYENDINYQKPIK